MPKKKTEPAYKTVETLTHPDANRVNIPTAEYQSIMRKDEQSPIRLAYERRNRDLDPQLVWRGKDEQDWSDLVVHAPPLYIQEKVHPKVLIDDLAREREGRRPPRQTQLSLFADFNGISEEAAKTEFYQHEGKWQNRMILGDSLQVMASLAEREGLRGQVQCIYFDPPYGIKFNSNFQWSTTSRDVKDGKTDHITREPEQVKAFRDTWRDGIHSYLTYLRDRLTVARDLLTDSGSIFVQISNENFHRVTMLMDEVFGDQNRCTTILMKKSGWASSTGLPQVHDFIVWYAKNIEKLKYRQLYRAKLEEDFGDNSGAWVECSNGTLARPLTPSERQNAISRPNGWKLFVHDNLTSTGPGANSSGSFVFQGSTFWPGVGGRTDRHWKTVTDKLPNLNKANRLMAVGNSLRQKRYLTDFPVSPIADHWNDTAVSGFADSKVYVVQTNTKAVDRCILMATDPGDLVLDPTCGSGTTAYVAEQWGRRWITIDTSRVALALARSRIMGARYPYYLLADSPEGQVKEAEVSRTEPSGKPAHGNIRHGFVYERVPHITLKSIANNAEIDVIWERFQETLEPLRQKLNAALGTQWEEWEIPREAGDKWPKEVVALHTRWWESRIARQREIDASIAAKADYEYLYDKPFEDKKKVRVAGPFTVESLSPHRVLIVDHDDELKDPLQQVEIVNRGEQDFVDMILENLKTSGVQQSRKEDKISFISLATWPGEYICAEGLFEAGEQWLVAGGLNKTQVTNHKSHSQDTSHQPQTTTHRAAVFIGPEFGTVSRPDLVAAAREAGDAGFDALIACAFNYDAHSADFTKLGRIPVLKARMNADLHMADDLKNTGKGNLFVVFGEPDVEVTSGLWLVTRNGRMVARYDSVKELSGLGGLAEINRLGREGLSRLTKLPAGGALRADQPVAQSSDLGSGEHRGRGGSNGDQGVSPIPEYIQRLAGRDGNLPDSGPSSENVARTGLTDLDGGHHDHQQNDRRSQAISALKTLNSSDFPLTLTTNHFTQVTIHGVDVFHPTTGEVRSDDVEGIACWFIDTDYNEESFFVRHAYFLGANDPYKALKTTLKAEIDAEAWETLNSNTSRPFPKPESGRIAVKVINHLGDEVMKVIRVE